MKKSFLAGMAAGLVMFGVVGAASAALALSDMQLNGKNANAASFISGNDRNQVGLLNDQTGFGGNEFTFIATADPGSGSTLGSLGGIDFSISTTAGTSGTWGVAWSSALPAHIDLVGVLKASNSFSAYLFDNVWLSGPGSNNPNDLWKITFTNNGGQIPDLSHLSLYGRDVTPATPIPVPGAVWLFGSGLAGLVGLRRNKKD